MSTWQDHERDAWLGDTRHQMTSDQLDRFDTAAAEILDRWASGDDPEAGMVPRVWRLVCLGRLSEQLSGALQVILGDDTLTGLGADRAAAQQALDRAHARLQGAILASRQLGPSEIARQSGLSRQTVHLLLNQL